ncbi:MAG TPA: hypothetical protein VHY20_04915 [Pirellulales bacterium]|nr:hypothetical protein [Pirellulales bacterium]
MGDPTVDLLNRLLVIEYRTLPLYLVDATPWTHPGDTKASVTLRSIVANQRGLSQRLAAAIMDRGGTVEAGDYPTEFTELNFLSLDYLLRELVRYGKEQVARIAPIAQRITDGEARELALEVLGSEKAHVEMLQELCRQVAA